MTRSRPFLRSFILTLGAILGAICILWTLGLALLGITPLIVLSGSMSPTLETGDLAFARTVAATEVQTGDIVSVVSSDGVRITHRVVESEPAGDQVALTLKGDANGSADSEVYLVDSTLTVVGHAPGAGFLLQLTSTPWAIGGAIALLAACLLIGWRSRNEEPADPPSEKQRVSRQSLRPLAVFALVPLLAIGATAAPQSTIAYFTDSPTATTPIDGIDAAPLFTCNQAADSPAFAPNPIIYYPLNDPTGSTATTNLGTLGAGYNGVVEGTAVTGYEFGSEQPCGRDGDTGLWFGQTDASVGTPDVASLARDEETGEYWNTFTVSLWFRGDSATRGALIGMNNRQNGTGTSHDRKIYVDNTGRLHFGVFVGGAGGQRTLATPAQGFPGYHNYLDPVWHMVTATLSPEGIKLYIDGVLEPGTLTEQNVPASSVTTGYQYELNGRPAYWVIGNTYPGGGWPGSQSGVTERWLGEIAKVGIWDRALTDQEIRDLHRSALPINP